MTDADLRAFATQARAVADHHDRLLADLHRCQAEQERLLAICEARQLSPEERGALDWLRAELARDVRIWRGQERAGRIEAALAALARVMG